MQASASADHLLSEADQQSEDLRDTERWEKDVMEDKGLSEDKTVFRSSPLLEWEKMSRRSPTSKDEFWDALRSHYNYLMDDGLIATCREASSDLSYDDEEEIASFDSWSFTEFIQQFNLLHDLLHHLQSSVSRAENKEEVSPNIMEERGKVAYLCKLFNDQAKKLSKKYPDMRDEIHRRLNLLNNKWEAVEQSINPHKPQPAKDGIFDEISNQMRSLRRWLRELEERLQPIMLPSNCTLEKLEEKYKEQQLLQIEIEAKGKYVSSLLKLCACLEGNVTFRQPPFLTWDAERVRRVANNLEHRWHSIWLRSLERQYRIEDLINRCKSGVSDTKHDLSFSEEPVKKYPRLSGEWDDLLFQENEWDCQMDTTAEPGDDEVFDKEITVKKCHKWVQHHSRREIGITCAVKSTVPQTNDKGIMVGPTTIAKMKADSNGRVGEFEIVQDVGYSSETSAHFSNDEPIETTNLQNTTSVQGSSSCKKPSTDECEAKAALPELNDFSQEQNTSVQTAACSLASKPYLAPDKYPAFNLRGWQFLSNDDLLCKLKHNQCSAVPDSFYKMTSVDSDTFDDAHETTLINDSDSRINKVLETASIPNNINAKVGDFAVSCLPEYKVVADCCIKKPHPQASSLNDSELESPQVSSSVVKLGKRNQKSLPPKSVPKSLPINVKNRRCARVCEWLNTCHSGEDVVSDDGPEIVECVKPDWSKKLFADSSCDASGEYTTTESDCDRSAVSDDVNNSLSLTQSFTGSVETVVPVLAEETIPINEDCVESTKPSPVVLRRKKRLSRDRPWSVTEVHQTHCQPAQFSHSTSESALDRLVNSCHDTRKTLLSCKKLSLGHTKSSLPDVTHSSCCHHSRRTRSRGSLHYVSRHSDTGSDGCLSCKKKLNFSSNKPSSLDSSQNSSATPLEQLPSSLTSASECTNDVLHSSSSTRHRSSASACSKSSACSSHRKRRSKSFAQKVPEKLGPKCEETLVERKAIQNTVLVSATSSSNCDHPNSNVEDHSSVSDQVWDEYQDPPYLSEPYSEQTVDEDQVQRLINFGDDYRTVLGSHSDASSINAEYYCRKFQGKSRVRSCLPHMDCGNQPGDVFDSASDSDTEDFHNILTTSHHALQFVESVYNSLKDDPSKNSSCSSEFAELVATCQTNLCHLHAIRDELDMGHDLTTLSNEDLAKLHDLIKEWEVLQVKLLSFTCKDTELKQSSEEVEAAIIEVCSVMATLKEKLSNMSNNALKALDAFSCLKELENKIIKLQMGLATLQEMKETVLSVSARIVRLAAEGGGPSVYPLRDSATKLYQQWEDVYELSGSQLTKLQTLRSGWKQSEENDVNKELETAVQWQPVQVGSSLPQSQVSREVKLPTAGAEVLEPDCYDCVMEISDQPDMASAKCFVAEGDSENIELPLLHLFPPTLKFQSKRHTKCNECDNTSEAKDDNISSIRVKKTRSRLWRTIRAAVPIQVALVMLYCMACLLEPHCCDSINNLNFDFWPQLRYLHGPPPV